MSDYTSVQSELDKGTAPELLCATCPWSRPCLTPPTMTTHEIERKIKQAAEPEVTSTDGPRDGKLFASLVTALVFSGKATSAQICPVFALRLTGEDGRGVVDGIRQQMRGWPS